MKNSILNYFGDVKSNADALPILQKIQPHSAVIFHNQSTSWIIQYQNNVANKKLTCINQIISYFLL